MKKKLLIFLTLLCVVFTTNAQVKIGSNPTTINVNAILEMETTNKGALMPRISLVALNNPAPLSAHVSGMIVYNKGGFGASVEEGFYYNDGTKWIKINPKAGQTVNIDQADPNTSGTGFTPNLPADPANIYASDVDGSFWKYDAETSTYITFIPNPSTEWYLTGGVIDAAANKIKSIYRFGEVGIGSSAIIETSAMLDVNSTTKGILPPRMTQAQRDAIVSPATGLVLYCTDCNAGDGCLVTNYGTPAIPAWECFGTPKGSIVSVDCPGSAINGIYLKDIATTAANTVTFKVVNNTFSSITNNFSNWVTLSGAGVVGLTVATTPTPAQPVTIAAGANLILTYAITGTPVVNGSFTARFSGRGMTCEKTTNVQASTVVPDCSNSFVYGLTPIKYLKAGTTYTGGTVRIPYRAFQAGVTYAAQTITTASGITLTRTAGTFTSPSGYIEYTIGGTYTGANCSTITESIDVYAGQTCTVTIGDGFSSYKAGVYATSSNGYSGSCNITQTNLADGSYTSGWASPNAAANQWVEITFPLMSIKQVVLSGGPIACWLSNAQYVAAYSNAAGLQLEYWNGSAWVGVVAVPTLYQDRLTTINIACDAVNTTKLRVRNTNAQWFGIGEFYPVGYWDSKVPPPSLNCNAAVISGMSPSIGLVNGQSYSGTVTVNYTSTISAAYPAETVSRSGITLTRTAGTMVNGSGSIVYTISGTYTGVSYNTQDFPITLSGASCNITLGNPVAFLTGTYTATSTGYGGTCPATQSAMTDASYTTGWGTPTAAANQWIQIAFGSTKVVKSFVASGATLACWLSNQTYVTAYANYASLVFEYSTNGTTWTQAAAVSNNLSSTATTTYTLATPVSATHIRVRNSVAQWYGLGTFYPLTY